MFLALLILSVVLTLSLVFGAVYKFAYQSPEDHQKKMALLRENNRHIWG